MSKKYNFTCPVCGSHHSFTVDTSHMSELYMDWREYCPEDGCYGSVAYTIEKEEEVIPNVKAAAGVTYHRSK